MSRQEWNRARVEQFALRSELTLEQARRKVYQTYMPGCNMDAVDQLLDPVVDPEFQSTNRPQLTPLTA